MRALLTLLALGLAAPASATVLDEVLACMEAKDAACAYDKAILHLETSGDPIVYSEEAGVTVWGELLADALAYRALEVKPDLVRAEAERTLALAEARHPGTAHFVALPVMLLIDACATLQDETCRKANARLLCTHAERYEMPDVLSDATFQPLLDRVFTAINHCSEEF